MNNLLIYVALFVFFIFIFWASRELLTTTKKMGIKNIRDNQLKNYVLFIVNYKKGEAAEARGDKEEAKSYYERALSFLLQDRRKDELCEKNISELKRKIAELRGS